MEHDDPLERRRFSRERQARGRALLLAGVAGVVGVGLGVVGTTAYHRRAAAGAAPLAEPDRPPMSEPAKASGSPPSRKATTEYKGARVTVTGVLVIQTVEIHDFIDMLGGKGDGSAEPSLVVKRQNQPDVICFFPRNESGAVREVATASRPVVTISGVPQGDAGAVLVLHDCRLVAVNRREP